MENENTVQQAPATEKSGASVEKKPFRANNQNRKRKKVCQFCVEKVDYIDYKEAGKLRKLTSERAKILPRRVTGTCAKHQRQLALAIKEARHMALLSYVND